jgi:hypothetical protein
VAAARDQNGDIRTVVAPITHTAPQDPLDSIEIPQDVCRRLKLDTGRHWLRLDELNRFAWPGYDLRPIPHRPGVHAYGMLPPGLFEALREGILARQKVKRPRVQPRG